jgi:hypothetical protein
VEHANNQDRGARPLEKYDVAAFLSAPQARPYNITRTAERGVLRQRCEPSVQPPDVDLLLPVPSALSRVQRDPDEIGVGFFAEVVPGHLFAPRTRFREDAFHARILRPSAGDAFLDGRP